MNPPLSHPHVLPAGKKRPAIALIIPNTLTALGLSGLLTRMVPHAEIALFHDFREAEEETERGKAFFHYFTTAPVLLNHAAFFLRHQQKTIVLVHGDDVRHLPQGFHTLNVLQSEKELVRAFLLLAEGAHNRGGRIPDSVREAQGERDVAHLLTPRERDVLRLLVEGNTSKEIAHTLGVEISTVISHRKNLAEKMGTKNMAALTIFAVTHGIVKAEDI